MPPFKVEGRNQTMQINQDEATFGILYPYVIDENVTDIRWNGRCLWIEDLKKGRYKTEDVLDENFLKVFTSKIAAMANVNFNMSESSLQAATSELRIHAVHPSRTGDNTYIIAIRKTPAVARITDENIEKQKYADKLTKTLLSSLVRSHCSCVVIGDTGAGKTELLKYMASFLPENEACLTIEDTLELRLTEIYPEKDISAIKIDEDYPPEQAIRDALRLLVKYMWIAESRGREIARIVEGVSTGCTAAVTIHADNVWEVPDRVVQMGGKEEDGASFEDDVYRYFDAGIKVSKEITEQGVHRRIDQIAFYERIKQENRTIVFMKNGTYTGEAIPDSILEKFETNQKDALLKMMKEMQ